MHALLISVALLLAACTDNCPVYHVPPEARTCQHECAVAVAQGHYESVWLMNEAYYRCLGTCPGVWITNVVCY